MPQDKANPGYARLYNDHHIDLPNSFVVGDAQMDIDLGKGVGCQTILIPQEQTQLKGTKPDYITADLYQAAKWIVKQTE